MSPLQKTFHFDGLSSNKFLFWHLSEIILKPFSQTRRDFIAIPLNGPHVDTFSIKKL